MRAAPAAALLAWLAGCGNDWAPFQRLESLRVLAIRSEPVAPAPGETTTFTPLLFTPAAATFEYEWSWCPFAGSANDGYPCMVTEEDLAKFGGAGATVPAFDLGAAETATLTHTVDPALLAHLCEGDPDAPFLLDCEGGFPAQIRLTVRTEDDEVVAVRRLRLRLEGERPPNANPTITGLAATLGGKDRPIGGTPDVALPREQETRVVADVPEDAAESWVRVGEDGGEETVRETLALSWFVESGRTESDRTGFIDGVTPFARALENTWRPDSETDYESATARIVVVVRDDREGVAWRSGIVALEGAR